MASGTPVVCSKSRSLPEVVGEAAMMVSPDNVFDIARGIREVLLSPALRQEMIERGHAQVAPVHLGGDGAAGHRPLRVGRGRRHPVAGQGQVD